MSEELRAFDLLGELPAACRTTVLEASAGTGKTYALAGLVARYVVEEGVPLERMLLITFGRAASQELRSRVREQLVAVAGALDDPSRIGDDALLARLAGVDDAELDRRRERVRDALADFDAATIATTHQFCQLVLRSLGVAGDSETGLTLVESLDDLVKEVVDDLYLAQFGAAEEQPALSYDDALALALEVVDNPHARPTPVAPPPGRVAVRVAFARDVTQELERRKRRLGVLGYDDLLGRLADALAAADAPARERMRQRWSIVMVDEFQDTDPVQWQVIDRAFTGVATVVLIGDPKQAIYAFRGGDIVTYLDAAETADARLTLGTNWRSDQALVERVGVLLGSAALGDERIVVRPVEAHHRGHRLAGAPANHPIRLRLVDRGTFGVGARATVPIDRVREHVAADLAADIRSLLASGATWGERPLVAGDVAVIVESHKDARACRDALARARVPAVYTGDVDVFASEAAADWQCLLEACDQPHRSGLVRSAALTRFFGHTPQELADDGRLTDRVAETLREWVDHLRRRGIAAVHEAARAAGLDQRVLAVDGGERHLTDLTHVAQLLHETAQRERLALPGLLDWLRHQRREVDGTVERTRRLDSDAAAVQILTVWVSKGLQYPIVYLPFSFNRHVGDDRFPLYHVGGRRCLEIGGPSSPDFKTVAKQARTEAAGDNARLSYVALTRAQSQLVLWWAPTWDEPNGGLARLLRGRGPGDAVVPERIPDRAPPDAEAREVFARWEEAGGLHLEESVVVGAPPVPHDPVPRDLGHRAFTRTVDTAWRRTSYSGLIRVAQEQPLLASEPEVGERGDEVITTAAEPGSDEAVGTDDGSATGEDAVSPMSELPSSATFGSLVHGVLEAADPEAPDLTAELLRHVEDLLPWWPVSATATDIAEALVPLHHTPLGPWADGLTLAGIPLRDRLCELDFEIPLCGGDLAGTGHPRATELCLRDVGVLLDRHLADDDVLRPYVARLLAPGLGGQPLRGYLSGSIDVVLRVPDADGGHRYLVVDYKTNHLGDFGQPLLASHYAPARLATAMVHSDYPLQALLYTVVVHRFLRWRVPDYDPARHLAGVLYLYVRGMCGAETPTTEGVPAGVFGWRPPADLVVALSALLDGSHDDRAGDGVARPGGER